MEEYMNINLYRYINKGLYIYNIIYLQVYIVFNI